MKPNGSIQEWVSILILKGGIQPPTWDSTTVNQITMRKMWVYLGPWASQPWHWVRQPPLLVVHESPWLWSPWCTASNQSSHEHSAAHSENKRRAEHWKNQNLHWCSNGLCTVFLVLSNIYIDLKPTLCSLPCFFFFWFVFCQRSRNKIYLTSTLSAPRGVTNVAGANAYAAKLAASPTPTKTDQKSPLVCTQSQLQQLVRWKHWEIIFFQPTCANVLFGGMRRSMKWCGLYIYYNVMNANAKPTSHPSLNKDHNVLSSTSERCN